MSYFAMRSAMPVAYKFRSVTGLLKDALNQVGVEATADQVGLALANLDGIGAWLQLEDNLDQTLGEHSNIRLGPLRAMGITTAHQLTKMTRTQLMELNGYGMRTVDKIQSSLAYRGLSLADDEEEN